ncbi:hypothetical protein [Mucilaginibacter sp.]|uniref:hypothetical protein n=1 Tax=Mucilaginibacter sp. TaxID=1882438 RepID=UPI0025F927B5|nr:hypothetical protein [Mucilaginibacter sp.]
MRRLCVFSLTAFYLLLTTGTYSCLLHCTTEFVFSKLGIIVQSHETAEDDAHKGDSDKDDEKCGDDCSCCYHHGTYVVNENFSGSPEFQFSIVHLAILEPAPAQFAPIPTIIGNSIRWPGATGPPFVFSQPIYISNHSLLI